MGEEQEQKFHQLTEEPVSRMISHLAVPCIISMLVTAFYNMADTFFVGMLRSNAATGAVGVVFSMMAVIQAVGFFFGHGSGNFISRELGRRNTDSASNMAATGFFSALFTGLLICVFGEIFLTPLAAFLGSSPTILPYAKDYLRVILIGAPWMTASLVLNNQLRFQGNAIYGTIGIASGAVLNIGLDPLLIFGLGPFPQLGITGAALATGLGQSLTLGIYLVLYHFRPIPVTIARRDMAPTRTMVRRLYAIGVPATLNLALPSVLVSALNGILATFSQGYVLVLGIYYKLQTFLYLPANGFVQGMRPLVGYNYGAGEIRRVRQISRVVLGMSGLILAAGTVVCQAIPAQLMGLFTANPETVAMGAVALRVISLGFVVSAVSVTLSGALEGLGKGLPSLAISLCRYLVVILPVAWGLSRTIGPTGVWHAFWITEVLTALVAYPVYHRAAAQH